MNVPAVFNIPLNAVFLKAEFDTTEFAYLGDVIVHMSGYSEDPFKVLNSAEIWTALVHSNTMHFVKMLEFTAKLNLITSWPRRHIGIYLGACFII